MWTQGAKARCGVAVKAELGVGDDVAEIVVAKSLVERIVDQIVGDNQLVIVIVGIKPFVLQAGMRGVVGLAAIAITFTMHGIDPVGGATRVGDILQRAIGPMRVDTGQPAALRVIGKIGRDAVEVTDLARVAVGLIIDMPNLA